MFLIYYYIKMTREKMDLTWEDRVALLEEAFEFYKCLDNKYGYKAIPFGAMLKLIETVWEIKEDVLEEFIKDYVDEQFNNSVLEQLWELPEWFEEIYKWWVWAVAWILMNDKKVILWTKQMMKSYGDLEELKAKFEDKQQEKEDDIAEIKAEINIYFKK